MDLFYTRVSTTGQNDERQFDGEQIDPNNLYQDKISGAKKKGRSSPNY
jgi:DNA invertase Pin-like site-specific DNA recombinase